MITVVVAVLLWLLVPIVCVLWLDRVESQPAQAPLTEMALWVHEQEALNLANEGRIDAEIRERSA